MTYWIKINESWVIKLTKEGIELSNFEKNINIDLSTFTANKRERVISIFRGGKAIARTREDNLRKIFEQLRKEGILRYSNIKSSNPFEKSRNLNILRKNFVSVKGPVLGTYHLNPANSKFYPVGRYIFSAKYITTTRANRKLSLRWTSGVDENKNLAEIKAIMEALERFASGYISKQNLIITTSKKIGIKSINPNKVITYSETQYNNLTFPLKKFSENKIYYWKEINSLFSKEKFYLPIECIYYPIKSYLSPNNFTFCNSSGVAAGFNERDVIKRGIFEIIERDAFMITWINRLEMPRLKKNNLSPEIKRRIKEIKKVGFEIHFVNLTLDTLPVILVCAISNKSTSLLLGAGSDLSIHKALNKALGEVEMGLFWELRGNNRTKKIKPENVKSVDDHVILYKSEKYINQAAFLWKGREMDINDLQKFEDFGNLIEKLRKMNFDIFFVDLTPPIFKNTFVKVYRVIIPGFVPISFGYGREPLKMERVKKIPHQLGLKTNKWDKIPLPHPFP